jgi:PAS domain S-box-containing protein/putative nucleotidyltransferase with HDIG domain
MQNLNKNGIINYTDVQVKTKSGQNICTDIYLVNKTKVVQCNVRDITERKQAEESLQKSEENFRLSLDDSPLGVRIVTAEGETLYANRAIADIYGFDSVEELKGAPLTKLYTPESYDEFQIRKEKRERGESGLSEYEISIVRKNGEVRRVHVFRKEIFWNGARQFHVVYQDITDRKQAEETLRQSESNYRLLSDNIHDVIFVLDMNLNFTYISPSVKMMRGYEPEEVLKQSSIGALTPSSRDLAMKTFSEVIELEKSEDRDINISRTLQLEMTRKDGTTVWTEMKFSFIRDEQLSAVGIVGVTRDITERKQAEESLRVSEEKYRIVVENAKEAIIVTQDMKVVFVNRAGIDMIGYSDKKLTPQPIINFIHPDDIDMVADHHIRRLNGEDVQNVYSFRLVSQDGTVKWVEINAAVIKWKEKPATLNFLNDITERKQAEEELHQTLEKLRKAFASTVGVMVSAVEMRDPYTAGHQLRVANLACAIAAEMGLSNDKIEGLRMAGFIHDIGKLSIPAEILSKPTKLTNTEFSLIKEHAQSGYEMLKSVESPWPLAQIVYQHHERMNGSGYPRNLKGDEILMEARIMAVADVVEAMASHRPYRAALGIEVALEEIEKNRGIFYDVAVADACLKLFREKGYKLLA